MDPILSRNRIWEKISELNSKLLFVKQLVNTIEENIKELTGVDINHLASREELTALEGELKTFTNNAIYNLDISKYATKTHVEEIISEAIEQIPEPEPPNLEPYLEKSEVFKGGDNGKNIEIAYARPSAPTPNSDNTNIFIGGSVKGINKGIYSTVIGFESFSSYSNSICIGSISSSNKYGVAIGVGANAFAENSISIGSPSTTTSEYSIRLGNNNYNKCNIGPSSFTTFTGTDEAENKVVGITFNEQPKLKNGLTPTDATDIVHKQYVDNAISQVSGGGGGGGGEAPDLSNYVERTEIYRDDSVSIGPNITSIGKDSINIGNQISFVGKDCITIGNYISNSTPNSIVIGSGIHLNCRIGGATFTTYTVDPIYHGETYGITFNERPKIKAGLSQTDDGLVTKAEVADMIAAALNS